MLANDLPRTETIGLVRIPRRVECWRTAVRVRPRRLREHRYLWLSQECGKQLYLKRYTP
ncbi:hypothetical protein [Streptomyces sp. BBFR2]|uniref:hypothetical protein n=1 Tax=Streptomyces sp. BBFR2 TaxID=3372854 RepID=UPI0037D99B35